MANHNTEHQEWLVEELSDPELAALYLTAALDDSTEMFLEAVKNVAQAKHKISDLAKQAGITRESVYRSFSAEGNPAFKTFYKFLDMLDIEIEFRAKSAKSQSVAQLPEHRTFSSEVGGSIPSCGSRFDAQQ